MIVKDIHETRFSDNTRVRLKRETENVWKGVFGYNLEYDDVYDGPIINIPKEFFELQVKVLKPISDGKMVLFCK